jgi:hypothetical protein
MQLFGSESYALESYNRGNDFVAMALRVHGLGRRLFISF